MIEAMDTELGRLLAQVDRTTTTIIFLGDNGTPNEVTAKPYKPDHAKLRVYEQGVKVPMIVAGAAVKDPGRQVTGLVNTVDLFRRSCGSPASTRPVWCRAARRSTA